ncbi:MAG: hypothetical protein H0U71_04915 [Gammaproteobacteria bacterium]|nr:hypothetical protein [Gammaproteobacteria bacterium]
MIELDIGMRQPEASLNLHKKNKYKGKQPKENSEVANITPVSYLFKNENSSHNQNSTSTEKTIFILRIKSASIHKQKKIDQLRNNHQNKIETSITRPVLTIDKVRAYSKQRFANLREECLVKLESQRAGLDEKSNLYGIWDESSILKNTNQKKHELIYLALFSIFKKHKIVGPTGETGIKYLPNIKAYEVKLTTEDPRVISTDQISIEDNNCIIFNQFEKHGLGH